MTLTFSILDAPSKSGQGRHIGVASSFLAALRPGDKLNVAVRPSHSAFHLPADAETTPVICVAAGTGVAPFRGFMQERAAMIAAGRKLAPAVLFYGCREPGKDDLYPEEFAKWEEAGAVKIFRVYSRKPELSQGRKHVQDALWEERHDYTPLWDEGARLYVCGSRAVGDAVTETALRLYTAGEKKKHGKDISEDEAKEWWEQLRNARYATDVFD